MLQQRATLLTLPTALIEALHETLALTPPMMASEPHSLRW
jgi:hypothetical protein